MAEVQNHQAVPSAWRSMVQRQGLEAESSFEAKGRTLPIIFDRAAITQAEQIVLLESDR